MKITTIKQYERRNSNDNQLYALIPVGTVLDIDEILPDYYLVTADRPITKDNDDSIYVSKKELDSMQ